MSYPTYPAYKDSGVAWLRNVPEHWKTIRIKHLTSVRRGASPRPIDDPRYFDDDGEFAWVRIADVSASERYLETTTQRLSITGQNLSVKMQPGNLFLSIAGTVGKPIISKIKCCIHDGFVYFPDFKENTEFLYYIFASGQPYLGLGKMGTQLNLNTDTVGSIVFGLPPLSEQELIARFLDYKTAQIDALIAKKETLLAKLAEKRTALISHAVTKGLDSSVPMKDSGVKWLGEIPAHWKVSKLSFTTESMQTGPFGSQLHAEEYIEGGVPLINPADISNGKIISNPKISVGDDVVGRLSRHKLELGDIVIARRGEMGRAGLVRENNIGWLCGTGSLRARLIQTVINPDFLLYQFSLKGVAEYLSLQSVGSTMDNLNTSILGRLPVVLPPILEQENIVSELHKKCAVIDKQGTKVDLAIATLKEYRSALITNAVTGKIDVRNFSIPGEVHHA